MTQVLAGSGPRASGVGSLPNLGSRDAVRAVRDMLVGDISDGHGVPYVPEQPNRGPGADMIGRAAAMLVEMSADLQPSGWRLTSAPGREIARGAAYLTEDLDEVAEAYDGYDGPLKTQVCGPWTLAATLWLPRGDRVLADRGATRDLAQSLTAGIVAHVEKLKRLVPGARLVVQLDEPALPAVLGGALKTISGVGRLRRIDEGEARDVLGACIAEVRQAGAQVIVHSCAPDVPVTLLRRAGADGIGLDTTLLDASQFDAIAEAVEGGVDLWVGLVPTSTPERHPRAHVDAFTTMWHRIGFGARELDRVVVTPACGLAASSPKRAVQIQRLAIDAAAMLRDEG